MTKKQLYADMKSSIAARLAELRKEPYSQLSSLPDYSDEERSFGKWQYALSVLKGQKTDDLVQIVVQAYYHWMFGFGTMLADGFWIQKSGDILEVPQEERYQFT